MNLLVLHTIPLLMPTSPKVGENVWSLDFVLKVEF